RVLLENVAIDFGGLLFLALRLKRFSLEPFGLVGIGSAGLQAARRAHSKLGEKVGFDVEDFRVVRVFTRERDQGVGRGLLVVKRHGAAYHGHLSMVAEGLFLNARETALEQRQRLFAVSGGDQVNAVLDGGRGGVRTAMLLRRRPPGRAGQRSNTTT